MKIGLVTRGKWTSKNDISQDVHTHTHTHIFEKVKFQNIILLSMLYTYLNFIISCVLL